MSDEVGVVAEWMSMKVFLNWTLAYRLEGLHCLSILFKDHAFREGQSIPMLLWVPSLLCKTETRKQPLLRTSDHEQKRPIEQQWTKKATPF